MKKGFAWAAGAFWLLVSIGQAQAQSPLAPYVEHEKRLRSAQEVVPLKSELFGDSISLYNGAIEFAVTDIDLPGNNALPVQLRRRFKVESMKEVEPLGGFGVWDLDVPYMYGTFDALYKWDTSANGVAGRCSENWLPQVRSPFTLREIWQGNMMHMPGSGDVEVLVSDLPAPNDGQTYTRAASGFYRFRCKSSTANGYPGEGFIAVDTSGTKYTFDVGIERGAGTMKMPGASMGRRKVLLMASRVEDRFGNWVAYTYSGDKLAAITASDGRSIALTWNGNTIVKAAANGREWNYAYTGGTGAIGMERFAWLSTVTLPDNSRYTYADESTSAFGALNTNYTPLDAEPAMCAAPDYDPNSFTLIATHPSGAEGRFLMPYRRLHRSGTPRNACVRVSEENYQLRKADYFDLYSIGRKTITGPGLPTLQWTYNYGDLGPARAPCPTACPTVKTVTVTQPDGSLTRSRFGILYGENEGRLLGTEIVAPDGKVLRSETTIYVSDDDIAAMPFPDRWGSWTGADDSGLALRIRPVRQTTTVQDGVTFTNTVNAFDAWTHPVSVTRTNTANYGRYSRIEETTYHDNTASWVLGQVGQVTLTHPSTPAIVESRTDYDAADRPWKRYSFGLLQQTLTYNADGTLATVADGKGNTTSLWNWKRGIPQTIQYADTSAQTAAVDDNGWIRSVTDENNSVTRYDYDAMGRVTLIDYPDADIVDWTSTVSNFTPVQSGEYGLGAGHWKQVVSTGNRHKAVYFDAFWRPVVEEQYDSANVNGTLSQSVKRYDLAGRLAFQSYPIRGLSDFTSVSQGTRTSYDALERITQVTQDSELGPLVTSTDYLPELQMQVTSPRGTVTTTTFMAYDQPTKEWPVLIASPEGAYTEIVRDALGKPLSIRRRNADSTVAVTRQYVYDANQRLCKSIEPETGATAMGYDAAGNLEWSAPGLSLSDLSSCDSAAAYASEQRAQRTYDSRNQLVGLAFNGGNGSQSLKYWPDGALRQVDTSNIVDDTLKIATNVYQYNKRGLVTGETLAFNDEVVAFGYQYDVLGNLAGHTYPTGEEVAYAPNALGQPTRAGTYANGVEYFPNGAMARFTYGNGLVHTLSQNARGLPERSRDAGSGSAVLDDAYDYDANGNVAAISDALPGNRGNRDLGYDGLDRLTTALSPMFGSIVYSYDVLDNIQSVVSDGRESTYGYDASNRLTNIIENGVRTVDGLGYDAQGNLSNKNGQIFTFDFGNRLRVAGADKYSYDGHGRRVRAAHPVKGDISSFYDLAGTLRYQHNEREAKAVDYVMLNGSLVAQVSRPATPAAPVVSVPGYSTNGAFTVGWNAVTGATSFNVEESVNGEPWQTLYSGANQSFDVTDRVNNAYTYRAQACNIAGCGNWGVPATAFVRRPPSPPAGITVPADGPKGEYTIRWLPPLIVPESDVRSGSTMYILEERFNEGAWIEAYSGEELQRSFVGKAEGFYSYRVKARNPYGDSGEVAGTNRVEVRYPPARPTLSVPPESLNGSYVVGWGAVDGATVYHLDESINGGTFTRVYSTAGTNAPLSGRQTATYRYQVTACRDRFGCSDASNPASITVIVPPTSAPSLWASAGSSYGEAYSLGWSSVATADRYDVYEQLNGGGFGLIYRGGIDGLPPLGGRGTGTWGYKVHACNKSDCGPASNVVTVQVVLPPSAPYMLGSLKMCTDRTPIRQACSASWTSAPSATRYELWSYSNGQTYEKQYDGPATSAATTLGQNLNWYCASGHVVRACNVAGCSAFSPPITQKVEIIVTGGGGGGDPW